MKTHRHKFRAIFASDWSECLSPCGPFDFIAFTYPHLESDVLDIFKQYTANEITLGQASQKIKQLLPAAVSEDQMDAYLQKSFRTYAGVPELIEWCLSNDILFMVNTTGMIGFFQRVFVNGLLPGIPVISAHPLVRYSRQQTDPPHVYDLFEIQDKSRNTETAARLFGIAPDKIIIMGDSGGDGPHFAWGKINGAFLIGSMTKPSLEKYCRTRGIEIDLRFGLSYSEGEQRSLQQEMKIDFRKLSAVIDAVLDRQG